VEDHEERGCGRSFKAAALDKRANGTLILVVTTVGIDCTASQSKGHPQTNGGCGKTREGGRAGGVDTPRIARRRRTCETLVCVLACAHKRVRL
jgi:hypothetical protein